MRTTVKKISCVVLFAIAMGFLESAVVIYLRALYYKDGFDFPLRPLPASIALVEILREAATLVMLVTVGFLAGKTKLQRFACFGLAFAIWDLFYYLFLYIFLGWPQSLFTWDLLFLIPMPWVGPVWAPCLLSVLMIAGAVPVIIKTDEQPHYQVKKQHWIFLMAGALLCILSFMWDYLLTALADPAQGALTNNIHRYVPQSFNHYLFFTGFAVMCYALLSNLFPTSKTIKS